MIPRQNKDKANLFWCTVTSWQVTGKISFLFIFNMGTIFLPMAWQKVTKEVSVKSCCTLKIWLSKCIFLVILWCNRFAGHHDQAHVFIRLNICIIHKTVCIFCHLRAPYLTFDGLVFFFLVTFEKMLRQEFYPSCNRKFRGPHGKT